MAVEQYQHNKANISQKEDKYLIVKTGGTHTKIFIEDIVYAEVFNRKIIIQRLADSGIRHDMVTM